MLTAAEDIEKQVERVTIPSKLDEVCDLQKQMKVGTMKYEPEVDRCTDAIKAAHLHEAKAVGDGLMTEDDKKELAATIKAGEDKKRASEAVLKKKSEIEMADAHASLHLHIDLKRLELAVRQGKRWRADAPKLAAAERKYAEAKKCRECYDELRLRTIGPDAEKYGSGGFTKEDGPDRLKGEENINKLGGPPGGPPGGALKAAADNFVKEAPEGVAAWDEGDLLHKKWLQERKELAYKEQKEHIVSNKFKVNLPSFEKKVAEAKKWLVDEPGEFGRANGRRRLAAATEAQRVLNLLLKLTAQSKFTVHLESFSTSIREAIRVNEPSTFEYGDANIDREIAAGEERLADAKDGQQKMYALVKQMEPKAINRNIDALKATHAAFGLVAEHETVTNTLIQADLKRDLMAGCLGLHANNERDRWQSGATLIASGAQSIRDYEAAQAALAAIKDFTTSSKIGPPDYLHLKVDCKAFKRALDTAENWELNTQRAPVYNTAVEAYEFAKAAQQARDNLREAVTWRIMPNDSNIQSPHALLDWAKKAKHKLDELYGCIQEGIKYVIEPHDIQKGETRYKQVDGEWKRVTSERLDGEMQRANYVLETDGSDLDVTNQAYQVYHGQDRKSNEAKRLLGEVHHAHKHYGNMQKLAKMRASDFKCVANVPHELDSLNAAIGELRPYLNQGRIRGGQAQSIKTAESLAAEAKRQIDQRRAEARAAINEMNKWVARCERTDKAMKHQESAMRTVIKDAKKKDSEFHFGGDPNTVFGVSEFGRAKKKLDACLDRIRKQEQQANH